MPKDKMQSENRKQRRGDTSRTSNQGQKLASGGSKHTDNKGRLKEDELISPEGRKTKNSKGR